MARRNLAPPAAGPANTAAREVEPHGLRRSLASFHTWRTVVWLIPTIAVYTIVLGTLSIGSSLFSGRGYFAHGCARLWSWLILATTGVRVQVRGLEQLQPGRTYVCAE